MFFFIRCISKFNITLPITNNFKIWISDQESLYFLEPLRLEYLFKLSNMSFQICAKMLGEFANIFLYAAPSTKSPSLPQFLHRSSPSPSLINTRENTLSLSLAHIFSHSLSLVETWKKCMHLSRILHNGLKLDNFLKLKFNFVNIKNDLF